MLSMIEIKLIMKDALYPGSCRLIETSEPQTENVEEGEPFTSRQEVKNYLPPNISCSIARKWHLSYNFYVHLSEDDYLREELLQAIEVDGKCSLMSYNLDRVRRSYEEADNRKLGNDRCHLAYIRITVKVRSGVEEGCQE